MIVVLKKNITASEIEQLSEKLRQIGCRFQLFGDGEPILRIYDKQALLSSDFFLSQPGVQDVLRITPAYELARKDADRPDSSVRVGDLTIDRAHFVVIAGPCAIESEEQITGIAKQL